MFRNLYNMKKRLLLSASLAVLCLYLSCQKDVLVSQDEQIRRNNLVVSQYLRENGIQTDSLPSGLRYKVDVSNPSGLKPSSGDTVFVNYEGRVMYGEIFDNSRFRGEPFSFPYNRGFVVKGFDQGVGLMRTGEIFTFYLPAHLAYGSTSRGSAIPANSNLIFRIELDSIKKL